MLAGFLSILLRFFLIIAVWAFVWHSIVPKTRLGRVFRAVVLVAVLVLARVIIAVGR
jgi:hypothetical protein